MLKQHLSQEEGLFIWQLLSELLKVSHDLTLISQKSNCIVARRRVHSNDVVAGRWSLDENALLNGSFETEHANLLAAILQNH